MKHTIPAVIFAGGKSARMGQDKALLPFGQEKSLASYQYHRLRKVFKEVYLSAKEKKFDFDAPLIIDRYQVYSPLTGIISAFETLDAEALFILSVDAPFVNEAIFNVLLGTWKADKTAIVARNKGTIQPLCGIYGRKLLLTAKEQMRQGNHTLKYLLEQVGAEYVDFEEERAFLNLNRPEEYVSALGLISS